MTLLSSCGLSSAASVLARPRYALPLLVVEPLTNSRLYLQYRPTIDSYISGTRSIQQQETLIGGFSSGGLGEVKYEVNNSAFMGEWGRPQNDGPALRVITLSEFAHHQLDHGIEADKEFVKAVLYDGKTPTTSVIKGDLEHIAHRWADPGFDRTLSSRRADTMNEADSSLRPILQSGRKSQDLTFTPLSPSTRDS